MRTGVLGSESFCIPAADHQRFQHILQREISFPPFGEDRRLPQARVLKDPQNILPLTTFLATTRLCELTSRSLRVSAHACAPRLIAQDGLRLNTIMQSHLLQLERLPVLLGEKHLCARVARMSGGFDLIARAAHPCEAAQLPGDFAAEAPSAEAQGAPAPRAPRIAAASLRRDGHPRNGGGSTSAWWTKIRHAS